MGDVVLVDSGKTVAEMYHHLRKMALAYGIVLPCEA
jgi:hypothetical protein